MKRKIYAVSALVLAGLLLFSSCGRKDAAEENAFEEIQTEPVEEKVVYKSRLTGLEVETEEDAERRPVAIMINNIKAALPQYGISKAGIVFEALAEGGITRLLAVFDDLEGVEQIGTIRSARPYYLDLAQSVDAVYIHIGGSPDAYSQIKSRGMDSFDLIEGRNNSMYWRDKDRIKTNGYEHSVFTSGARITEKLEAENIRMKRSGSYGDVFAFSEDASYSGDDALKITAVFSPYKTGTYTYDEVSGLYRIGQYGKAHADALYGTQLAFKNIFILRVNSYVIKGDTAGRLAFDMVGSGSGKYIVNGTATDIKWSRASKSAPFKLTTADGAELPVVPGDSYVSLVPLTASVNIEGAADDTMSSVLTEE